MNMVVPYKELFTLEQQFLPLLFIYWKKDVISVLCNFSDYCKKFDKKLKDFSFSMLPVIKYPLFIHPSVGKKVIRLDFSFEEKLSYLGLTRYIYLIYDKDYQNIEFYSVELTRNLITNELIYSVYEYRIDDIENDIKICKIYKGDYDAGMIESFFIKDENGIPLVMCD